MCGRFTLLSDLQLLEKIFGIAGGYSLGPAAVEVSPPRYNIAPTQPILAVRATASGAREFFTPRWGLLPPWAKNSGEGVKMINARSETAAEKPAFRAALRGRRCLIPASGWYEWQGQGKIKQPWYLHAPADQPFAFAGLWEDWRDPAGGGTLASAALLTTAAKGGIAEIHARMPVRVEPEKFARWLAPEADSAEGIAEIFARQTAQGVLLHPVGAAVGNARAQGAALIAPVEAAVPADEPPGLWGR
jgi:putative SOS response-associated peptidase YedK